MSMQAYDLHLLVKMGATAVHHLESVGSTMDAARELAAGFDFVLVSARDQTRGKGTRGREWLAAPGNVYMTVGFRKALIGPERLPLLPLELGLHLWDEAASRATPDLRKSLSLKWPNDLLFRGAKAGGILVESHGEHLLAGFGVNLAAIPDLKDGGSRPASLADAGVDPEQRVPFIEGLFRRIHEAPSGAHYDSETILLRWQSKVDWSRRHTLRDRPGKPEVTVVSVNAQGHLLVRHSDGATEWLVSDYLG
jgi:BirA family biotin operon repressor/biotin-[acetyl-CoA-carboxylase] ligase